MVPIIMTLSGDNKHAGHSICIPLPLSSTIYVDLQCLLIARPALLYITFHIIFGLSSVSSNNTNKSWHFREDST